VYDYLIVGTGLYGAVFAHEAKKRGKTCLVIEKREHIAGNIYTENKEDIAVHTYGAHIFHTSDKRVWDYINQFTDFNQYINSPVANYKGELYNLPFNMNTFYQMWGTRTPKEAYEKICSQQAEIDQEPKNLEEQAIRLVGRDIYEKLIKGYTEKQWGRKCTEIPAFIIKRLPVRYTYDNNYFSDRYQGIPLQGYTIIIDKLLQGIEVRLNEDFQANRETYGKMAEKIVYTGMLDAYFDYSLGALEYRGLRFETERLEQENYQGVAVMNFTDRETPYTRSIEHKHFAYGNEPVTYVTREHSVDWKVGDEAYYPVNDAKNQALYEKYRELAAKEASVIFGGRLAEYKYYNMDQVISSALDRVDEEFEDGH